MTTPTYPVYTHDEWFFKKLSCDEYWDFRAHAVLYDPENEEDWSVYHPVCREVWAERGLWPSEYPKP